MTQVLEISDSLCLSSELDPYICQCPVHSSLICDDELCSAVLTTLSLSLQLVAGRISLQAVQAQSVSLSTTEYTELTSSYGRLWKNEKLYSVSWAVQNLGVNTNFLVYSKDGSKFCQTLLSDNIAL